MILDVVLVTYNSGNEAITSLEKILPEVRNVYVFDNNSDSESVKCLSRFQETNAGKVTIHLSPTNQGLAIGQNWGIERSISCGAEWILLLDDDSRFTDGSLGKMKEFLHSSENGNGIVCPKIIDAHTGEESTYVAKGVFPKFVKLSKSVRNDILICMASGSFISSQLLEEVGLMDSRFFIDGIDTDFCLRALAGNFTIAAYPECIMMHKLGKRKKVELGNIRFNLTQHATIRYFYIFRNKILVWKKWEILRLDFLIYDLFNSFLIFFKIFFERDRFNKFKATILGTLSGLKM